MMNQEKIQELVNRSQQNDKRAFALLVSEFQPLVFRLAFRLLCDEDEARDITQETFVKVWLSLKTYNQENRLSTWLYKITCNTAMTACVRYVILLWIMNLLFPIR